jgi:hypothetical protein
MALALEQVVKPVPARGGGTEAAAIEDIVCTATDFCSSALDVVFSGFPTGYQVSVYQLASS